MTSGLWDADNLASMADLDAMQQPQRSFPVDAPDETVSSDEAQRAMRFVFERRAELMRRLA